MTDDEKDKLDAIKKHRYNIKIGDLEAFRVLTQEAALERAAKLLRERDPSIKKERGLSLRIDKLQEAIWPENRIELFDFSKPLEYDSEGNSRRVPTKKLSKAGAQLNPYIQEILSAWERLLADAKSIETDSTRLVIGAQYSIWNHIASEAASYFITKTEQNAVLEIAVEKAVELLNGLKGLKYDIVLLYDIGEAADLALEAIGDEVLVLVASQPYRDVSEIEGQNYLFVDYGETFAQFHQRTFRRGHPLYQHRLQFQRAGPAFRFLKDQPGIAAYLPWRMIYEYLADLHPNGDLYLVPGVPWRRRPIYIGTRRTEPKTIHDVGKNVMVDETKAFIASVWENRFEDELRQAKRVLHMDWPVIEG